jgi:hypothetical protein
MPSAVLKIAAIVPIGPLAAIKASATDLCQVDMSLSAGQITAHGLVTSTPAGPGTYFLAITGGTGAYQTAHGQVKITATTTNEVPITLYLIL